MAVALRRVFSIASKIFFIIAVLLILTNIIGLFTTLRNPAIFDEKITGFADDITLPEEQIYETIDAEIIDRKSYVRALAQVLSDGILHYWDDSGIDKYNLRIPVYENYLLFAAGFIRPDIFRKYEFIDYRKAIERGVGLCSQHALIVNRLLEDKDIESRIIGLSGHVVATARVDDEKNEWWIVDADFGVVVPHSLAEIEQDPRIVIPYYRDHGYNDSELATIVGIYDKSGNGPLDYSPKLCWLENATYVLIWVIPVLLMTPFVYQTLRARKPRRDSAT